MLAGCFFFSDFVLILCFIWLDLLRFRDFAKSIDDPSLQPLVPRLLDLLLKFNAANTAQRYNFGC